MLILNCNSSIPLQTAQIVFSNSQKFDDSLVVKQFCTEAMSILTHLIHPKFPIHFNNQQTNDFVPHQINDLESENDKTNKINENESKNEDFSQISQNEKASKRIIEHEEQEEAKNEIKENESSAVKKRKENELNELDKMLNDFNAD